MSYEELGGYWFDGHWFDRTLYRWHEDSIYEVAAGLDVDAGLAEILIGSRYEILVAYVGETLDIDAGLAAILPPSQAPDSLLELEGHASPFKTLLGTYVADFVLRSPRERLLARAWLPLARLPVLRSIANVTACAYDFALEVDAGEDLDRPRVCGFADDIGRLGELDLYWTAQRELVMNRARGLLSNPVPIYEIVETLVDVLRRALSDTAHHTPALETSLVGALIRDSEHSPLYARAHELAQVVELLEEAVISMAGADFTDINLRGIPLDGVRWTNDTQWPEFWADRIRSDSVLIAPGLWEVRAGGAGTGLSTESPAYQL
ncbi:hypothetical protein AB0J55_20255 [Amycolatopsis sp. NPDC049688]|uniref:hypothetical protein n=1 Tax=Amycolatopsis sp. NPDC049688 TaxID=3154733 RepID=UPI00342A7D08